MVPMQVTRFFIKHGFNSFGSQFGGSVAFGPKALGGARGAVATFRPDLGSVVMEKLGYPPVIVPLDNISGLEVESLSRWNAPSSPQPTATPEPVQPFSSAACTRKPGCTKEANHKGFCKGAPAPSEANA